MISSRLISFQSSMNRSTSYSFLVCPKSTLTTGRTIQSITTTLPRRNRSNGSGEQSGHSTKKSARSCYNSWPVPVKCHSIVSRSSKAWMDSADSIFIGTMATRNACQVLIHVSTVSNIFPIYAEMNTNWNDRTWSARVRKLRGSPITALQSHDRRWRLLWLCLKNTGGFIMISRICTLY